MDLVFSPNVSEVSGSARCYAQRVLESVAALAAFGEMHCVSDSTSTEGLCEQDTHIYYLCVCVCE